MKAYLEARPLVTMAVSAAFALSAILLYRIG